MIRRMEINAWSVAGKVTESALGSTISNFWASGDTSASAEGLEYVENGAFESTTKIPVDPPGTVLGALPWMPRVNHHYAPNGDDCRLHQWMVSNFLISLWQELCDANHMPALSGRAECGECGHLIGWSWLWSILRQYHDIRAKISKYHMI